MPLIGEFLKLPFIYLAFKRKERKEKKIVEERFYFDETFAKCDRELLSSESPYRVSKCFLKEKGCQDIHVYGETPLTVLERICREGNLSAGDTYLELGSGRGRGVFFVAHQFGCRAIGVEWIPQFVDKALAIKKKHGIESVDFILDDMCAGKLYNATFIYLYGTCLDEFSLFRLTKTLELLSSKIKIATVSYPLQGRFVVKSRLSVCYPWGETEVFIQEIP